MDIPFDPNSPDAPLELVQAASQLGRAVSAGDRALNSFESVGEALEANVQPGITIPTLDRWEIRAQAYTQEIAIKLSFLAGLFSGNNERIGVGIVHEAKRYGVTKSPEGKTIEVGVAVRLSVQTNSNQLDAQMTIPNVAATIQLRTKNMEARAGISVVGYAGPLGDLLPAPAELNVETFALFTAAFKNIQARVFGEDGVSYLSPTILAYREPKEVQGK